MIDDYTSKINMDRVPRDLNDAVQMIKDTLNEENIEFIKTSNPTDVHFNIGMSIRNDWSLWDEKNHLVKWFEKEYGITHADDISGLILDCVWRDVKGLPRRDREQANEIKLYWKILKEAEETGCNVSLEFDGNNNVKITKNEKK